MNKWICAILAIVLACGLAVGCTGQPAAPTPADVASESPVLVGDIPVSFPLASVPQTLKIMITGYNGRDQADVFVWQRYEEMTGVNVDWTTVTKETRSEAYHAALTNRQQYDLIFRCKLSATKLLRYGGNGLILDLAKDGLLQRCAPNCWAYLQSHPDALASVMNPDGSIYALPQVNAGAELRVAQKLYVNARWLERVQMDLPSTTEELRQLLTAFSEQDANGNGDPGDEIPLCSDWGSIKISLYGAFGLANRGFHNDTVDCAPDTGKVRWIQGCEPYRDFLAYVRGLYADGLLDKNVFDMTNEQLIGNIANDKVGMFAMTNLALLPADRAGDWVAVDEALTGPNGDKLWSGIRANFHSTGAAVIPSTCRDPELVLRWLDYFWTDEGTLFYHMGVEGETYAALADGGYDYLPKVYDEMAAGNLAFDDVVSQYSPYPGGNNPTVEIAPYFMGGEMADVPAQAARKLMQYGPRSIGPALPLPRRKTIPWMRSRATWTNTAAACAWRSSPARAPWRNGTRTFSSLTSWAWRGCCGCIRPPPTDTMRSACRWAKTPDAGTVRKEG